MYNIMENRKEITLEELIVKEKEGHEKRKELAGDNVLKIMERAASATGKEKVRLEALVVLHKNNHGKLLAVTEEQLIASATESYNKQKISKK
jgi:hypothetical protein